MLLVIRMDVRVKWPSERSEWLLDAAAALTQWKHPAAYSGGSAEHLACLAVQRHAGRERWSRDGETSLDHPGRD